ncbi:hypothetical protein ACFVWY_09960 [Streptomyces sp. NPDC058195]|uniref:hypothetical protein n=1 Tax=Streptomyces sp. NPDC058195 TaxID=3346375 RepID=UPI0036E327A4
MRSIREAPVALLGAAALVLTAPAASVYAAASGGALPATGFTVTPSVIPPGSQVVLAARGCPTTATAGSGVFDTVTLARGGSVAATVDWDARPGASYAVTFICATSPATTAKATLTIAGAPKAAAPAHGGPGDGAGTMSAATTAAGTALAVAAVTGAVLMARHRGENRSH